MSDGVTHQVQCCWVGHGLGLVLFDTVIAVTAVIDWVDSPQQSLLPSFPPPPNIPSVLPSGYAKKGKEENHSGFNFSFIIFANIRIG